MLYSYEAKDTTGQTVSGALEAESERVAATKVRDMGFFPMRLSAADGQTAAVRGPVATYDGTTAVRQVDQPYVKQAFPLKEMLLKAIVYPIWTGVSLRDLAIFYRQMSAMLAAGVPIRRTLESVRESTSGGLLRRIVQKLHDQILAGEQLSQGMANFPYVFTEMHREFIASAETTGHMPEVLTRLADYCEQEYNLRQMIKRETFQTKCTLAACLFIPNLPDLVLKGGNAYLQTLVGAFELAAGLLAAWVAYRLLMQTRVFSVILDTFKAYIPYFGNTVRMLAIAKFSRAFSALYSSGVLIPTALEISARVSGNAYLGSLIGRAVHSIKAGNSLTGAMAQSGVFPPMLISMVSTGEQTGNLDAMLDKVADFYEGEAQARLHKSAIALSILFFLLVAVYAFIQIYHFWVDTYGGQIKSLEDSGDQ